MAKYDFNNTLYAKFWASKDASRLLSQFINDPDIIKQRPSFWKTQFVADSFLTPRGADGRAVFSASVRKKKIENMLDMRAPMANTQPRDKQGLEIYTGTIPDFAAKGYVETGAERYVREKMLEEYFGNDAEIVNQYADDIQIMVDEANQTISNMAAQVISKASITWGYGTGIKGAIYEAPLPAENRVKAGAVAWTDTTNCKVIDQMSKIEDDYRTRTGYTGPMKWQMPRSIFNSLILKNAQVIAYISNWRKVNNQAYVEGMAVNEKMFNEAFDMSPMISPVEIVEEGQRNAGAAVSGWAANTVVLRPTGYAGVIKRAGILDKTIHDRYGSSTVAKAYAQLEGIFNLVNTTLNNGELKEWHTDLLVAAVPVLEELDAHVIVNVATAN